MSAMQEYTSSLYCSRDTKEDKGIGNFTSSSPPFASSPPSTSLSLSRTLTDPPDYIDRSTSNGSTASTPSRLPVASPSSAMRSPKHRAKPSPMLSPRTSPKRQSEPFSPSPPTPSSIRSNHIRNHSNLLPSSWIQCILRFLPTRIRLRCCQALVWGSPIFRFSMLFLSMAVLISGYFSYDLPGITSSEVKSTLNLNNASFGALFSVYAFPNSIMPLFSGAYFTKVGVWKGVLVISGIITFGIWLIAIAIAQESYILLLIGRAIYGIGGDSIYVGIDVLATGWFRDTEIGLAYGIIQAAGQAGSFIAFYGVPSLAEYLGNWRSVYYVAAGIAAFAFLALVIAKTIEDNSIEPENESRLALVEEDYNDEDTRNTEDSEESERESNANLDYEWGTVPKSSLSPPFYPSSPKAPEGRRRRNVGGVTFQRSSLDSTGPTEGSGRSLIHDTSEPNSSHGVHYSQNLSMNDSFDHEASDDSENEKFNHHHHHSTSSASHPHSPSSSSASASTNEWRPKHYRRRINGLCNRCVYSRLGDILGLEHLLGLSTEFWLVFLCIIIYSSVFYTFLAFGNDFLQTTYGMNAFESGRVVGLISISSCILSPTSGLLLDKVSGRALAAFIAMVLACVSFFLLGFTSLPVVPLIGTAGIAYSILPSALYPIIAEVVPDESFTVVYAAVNAGVNMLLTVTVYAVGWISHITADHGNANEPNEITLEYENDSGSTPNYYYVFTIFVTLTGIGTLASGYMLWLRWRKGTLFQKSELVTELDMVAGKESEEEEEEGEDEERGTYETEPILNEGKRKRSTHSWAPILRLQPHQSIPPETVTLPLTVPSANLTKETSFLPDQPSYTEFNQNLADEYRHEHIPSITGSIVSHRRGRTIGKVNPLPVPDSVSSTVLADLSKHTTMNLLKSSGGATVHRIRSAAGTAASTSTTIPGVGDLISSVPAITAATTNAGLAGPVFIRNDGKVYSGLGLAQRMGHNIPMQVMDARHRGGFTRPTLGFPYPFQLQDKTGSNTQPVPIGGKRGGNGSGGRTVTSTTTTNTGGPLAGPFASREESKGAVEDKAREQDDSDGNEDTKVVSKSYAGPYYLEQIRYSKNRRSRTTEPSSTSSTPTIGTGSYIITPSVTTAPVDRGKQTKPGRTSTTTTESLATVLRKDQTSSFSNRRVPTTEVRIEIPTETTGKEYEPLPSRSPP